LATLWIFLIDNMWVLRKEQLLDQQPSKYEHVANFVFNWRFLLQPSTWYTLLYLVNVIMQYHIPAHLNNISHLKCYFLNRHGKKTYLLLYLNYADVTAYSLLAWTNLCEARWCHIYWSWSKSKFVLCSLLHLLLYLISPHIHWGWTHLLYIIIIWWVNCSILIYTAWF